MSFQVRYGLNFGSGENGMAVEKKLREAAARENKKFPRWIIETLLSRAHAILSQPVAKPAN